MLKDADRIVVTGGAGFIGSHLVERLIADTRAEVVIFDDLSRGRLANVAQHGAELRLRPVRADIRDADSVVEALRGADVVYHLAARPAGVREVDVDHAFTANVAGTFNVLRAAARHAVGRLVFASSCEVYGEPVGLPVDEAHPLLTISPHGASKVAGEAFCRAFRLVYGLQVAVLRFADVYGPRDPDHPISVWVRRASAGQDLHVYGDKHLADFVWVGQAVDALIRAAELDGPLPPINVGSGTGTSLGDAARRVARVASSRAQIKLMPPRALQVTRFVANVERMRHLLRVEPPLDPLVHVTRFLAAAMATAG
jgi:UDP-glucose 4-epimerase